MALESIITPKRAAEVPWKMFLVGILYSTFAVFLSVWIFKAYASIIMVLLTVIVSVPLMYNTMKSQEKVIVKLKNEKAILKRHWQVLKYLLFLFGGFVVSYSFWFIVLPSTTVQFLFSSQIETIGAINSKIVGDAISSSSIFLRRSWIYHWHVGFELIKAGVCLLGSVLLLVTILYIINIF